MEDRTGAVVGEVELTTTLPHTSDPWTRVLSLRGYPADELISAFQKYIRRGNLEEAILIAREMYETSPELEEKMWQRLLVMACEDAGSGTFSEPVVVDALHRMRGHVPRGGDRWLFAAHAVRYLATASKDRTTDEMCMWAIQMIHSGQRLPVIPDYALDVHTRRGQEMGRDMNHFLDESSRIENRYGGNDPHFLDEIRQAVAAGEWAG